MTSDARLAPPVVDIDPQEAPPLRWGILGAGLIARKLVDAVTQHTRSEVVAVAAASSLERAQAFAEEKGVPKAYGTYEELVADPDVDVVYVATTHNNHHGPALLAIDAGKHVLVEKAFTQNLAQAETVVEAARARGVFLMEAMWTRHLPQMHVVRAAIARGDIGTIRTVHADHGHDHTAIQRLTDPELAGGAALDLTVYPVSLVHDLLGVPEQVIATGWLRESGVDAQEAMILAYPSRQALATIQASMESQTPAMALIGGTTGYLVMDRKAYEPGIVRLHDRDGALLWEYDGTADNGFQFEAAEVARCIAEGLTESPVHPLEQTLSEMRVLDQLRDAVGLVYPNER